MRNTFKRVLSTALAGLMLTSAVTVGSIAASANSGAKEYVTFQEACDLQWYEQLGSGDKEAGKAYLENEVGLVEYMFYMPDEWKNEYNDYYVEGDLDSYAAGIYWWSGSAMPGDCRYLTKGWPGYGVTRKADDCSNVYIAQVPADATQIIWNNAVDGGEDSTQPWYVMAFQGGDAGVTGYDPGMDRYGFYADGLKSKDEKTPAMAGMIYVCNPDDMSQSYTGKTRFEGEWFYYYGNGEYGYAPTREEAGEFVYSKGEFPPTKVTFSKDSINVGIGGTVTGTASKPNATGRVEDPAIASVTKAEDGTFTVTGLAAGTTNLIIESENAATSEIDTVTVPVKVTAPFFDETSITMKVGEEYDNIGYGLGENCKYSYSPSGIVTYDGYVVTAKKAGTATVKCTQGGKTFSFKVTVKPTLNKTSQKLAAGKTYTLKAKGGTATYTSSNPRVAKVDKKTGKVTALTQGSVKITATVNGQKATCTFKVTSNPKLAKSTAKVSKNKSTTLKITGAASKKDVKVSKCKVAKITVSQTKLTIKGTKKGTQKVTVTVNGKKLNLKVTVK